MENYKIDFLRKLLSLTVISFRHDISINTRSIVHSTKVSKSVQVRFLSVEFVGTWEMTHPRSLETQRNWSKFPEDYNSFPDLSTLNCTCLMIATIILSEAILLKLSYKDWIRADIPWVPKSNKPSCWVRLGSGLVSCSSLESILMDRNI